MRKIKKRLAKALTAVATVGVLTACESADLPMEQK